MQYCNWTIFSAILNMNNIQCNFVSAWLQCTAPKFTSTIQLCIAKRWTKIWKYSRVQNSHMQGSPILAPLASRLMTPILHFIYILLSVVVHLFVFLVYFCYLGSTILCSSYTSPINILPQRMQHFWFLPQFDITPPQSVRAIFMETTANKIRFFKTRNVWKGQDIIYLW